MMDIENHGDDSGSIILGFPLGGFVGSEDDSEEVRRGLIVMVGDSATPSSS